MSNKKISREDAKKACIAAYNNAMSSGKYGADLAAYMFFQGVVFARTDIIPKTLEDKVKGV